MQFRNDNGYAFWRGAWVNLIVGGKKLIKLKQGIGSGSSEITKLVKCIEAAWYWYCFCLSGSAIYVTAISEI